MMSLVTRSQLPVAFALFAVVCFAACSGGESEPVTPYECQPRCTGKVCGPDGCGGTCGTCSEGSCVSGACCIPDCTGKTCGSDGCGGSCDSCDRGMRCDAQNQCEPIPGIGETCTSNVRCTPGLTCRTDRAFADEMPTTGTCLACMTLAGQCKADADCCSGFCVPRGDTGYCAVQRYASCVPDYWVEDWLGVCCSGEVTTRTPEGTLGEIPKICVGCGGPGRQCRTGLDCCSGVCRLELVGTRRFCD
jgi:hypothetical protein